MVTAWMVVVAIAAATYSAFAGAMTSQITIPNTPTSKVTDMLASEFPSASGGSGTVVVTTEDGSAFTDAQRAAVSAVVTEIGDVAGVAGAVDPFTVEEQKSQQQEQLAAGQKQAQEASEQIKESQATIDEGRAAITAGRTELGNQIAQAKAAGLYEANKSEFNRQQEALDDKTTELDQAQAKVDASTAAIAASTPKADAGAQLLAAAREFRTVAADGSTAIITVQFTDRAMAVPQSVIDSVVGIVNTANIGGVSFYASNDLVQTIPKILGPAEIIGVLIAAIVLVVMLGTVIGAGLPIGAALMGVAVATLGSLSLSGVIDFISVTPVLGIMLGLAVGIDYSLFILSRHRRQLKAGMGAAESIALANGTSGNAVGFAGTTVIIALLGLNLTRIPFLALMGNVAAFAVLVAILIAVTLTPALLSLIGKRILRRSERATIGHEEHVAQTNRPMNTWRALATVLLGAVGLIVIALPATTMRLGLPDGSAEPVGSSAYNAYNVVADKFGAGFDARLLVVATMPQAVDDESATLAQAAMTTQIMKYPDVVAVVPIGVSDSGKVIAYQVIPREGPNAESTFTLVSDLRAASPLTVSDQSISIGVAGSTSATIDVSNRLADVLPMYLSVVVGLSFLILMIAFRSILVPLIASAGFVLSLLASFGGITAIYQWGWFAGVFDVNSPGPILAFLPVLTIGILFGLAMDYQLFIAAGMRESFVHGASPRIAVRRGYLAGRSVVAAAAVIMISVFGGFVFADSHMIRSIGFALAFGVLLDAFVVRMMIIPAAMHLLGGAAWWIPRWLDRLLPDADIEGAKLEREHPPVEQESPVESNPRFPRSPVE
ncbi:RND superfamily putative drug exporter [Rarobacter incanus]|uniref:RND superfamily putative drug exporter n=1 Tax=Rarobacter incanus TaxID=153494 RepID=A0A542SNL6_9MICO|nr:RND superfamily putative drug exporter [Rarobacter incanus]